MKEFSKNKTYNNFKNHKSPLRVVEGIVREIKNNELQIDFVDSYKKGICKFINLTDYNWNTISSRFLINSKHLFLISKFDPPRRVYWLNYKIIHPIEIKNKRRSYPTLSHDRNLRIFLTNLLENEDKEHNNHEIN